ncbi:helix-turn-helix domain-containing protein [Escherichia coli]|nr:MULTISPECIES: helix-turn-helix transcriptional regulator [Escherichia]EGN8026174.1 helix-turn-helix transcriptional regulator [Escherichia coli]EIU7773811.1 helix-turn-helix transcriptional regulator [Salmonella enterica]EGS5160198.1 helix-turn-helix transcriptional regulator [Escherichia coli]EJM5548048.1 helix-turn-helix transcriptional regulator [Salmonella enterica]EKX8151908.1 helix-turn-helix transcriptional regulator [Escherichia coli]
MNIINIHSYIKCHIKEYNVTAHIWIYPPLTNAECQIFELLVKGYSSTQISERRFRSVKTVSFQKHQIYKKLGVRNDTTFWLDLLFSSYVKIRFTKRVEGHSQTAHEYTGN